MNKISRRRVITGAAAVGVAAAGSACLKLDNDNSKKPRYTNAHSKSHAFQDGIITPNVPQSNVRIVVYKNVSNTPIAELLRIVGSIVNKISTEYDPGSFTATVGVGFQHASDLTGGLKIGSQLPKFKNEQLGNNHGGDIIIQFCADQGWMISEAVSRFNNSAGKFLKMIWFQDGSRGQQSSKGEFRNLAGFKDGIINPREKEKQEAGVWIDSNGKLSGSTLMVVRRLRFDTSAWNKLSVNEQEAAVGRNKIDGAPLSGGKPEDQVDLGAKKPTGEWITPAGSHARRAHPSFIGKPLMLRRGYGFSNSTNTGSSDEGVLFIAYMNDSDTFIRTQQRLDELDDLLDHAVCTGSGLFFIPPASFL